MEESIPYREWWYLGTKTAYLQCGKYSFRVRIDDAKRIDDSLFLGVRVLDGTGHGVVSAKRVSIIFQEKQYTIKRYMDKYTTCGECLATYERKVVHECCK